MKLVINKCFGGFGISHDALFELVKRNAKCIEKTPVKEYYGKSKINMSEWKDFKDGFKADDYCCLLKNGFIYQFGNRYELEGRADPDLIDVVKKMKKKANGMCADLKIIDIPRDIKGLELDEYDGMESINEKHESWG